MKPFSTSPVSSSPSATYETASKLFPIVSAVVFLTIMFVANPPMIRALPNWEAEPSPLWNQLGPMVTHAGVLYTFAYQPHSPYNMFLMRWSKYEGWQTIGELETSGYGAGWALFEWAGQIYVGGSFYSAGGINATNIAKYDPVCGNWSTVGDNTTAPVHAITITDAGEIYIGMHDPSVMDGEGGQTTENILKMWNGSAWETVGEGLVVNEAPSYPGYWGVTALATDGTNIYAGGDFQAGVTGSGQVSSRYVIKWDGTTWHSMDLDGIDYAGPQGTYYDHIRSIAVCDTNVFVAGNFRTGDIYPLGLVRFSTSGVRLSDCDLFYSTWNIPDYPQGYSLAVLDNTVYVTGAFDTIGDYETETGITAHGIAQWTEDGTADGVWSPLGTGLWWDAYNVDGMGYSAAANETAVYVSGLFDQAGGIPLDYGTTIARYVLDEEPPSPKGMISAGAVHTLAVRYDGTVWAWGGNPNGQLGGGAASTVPVQVANLTGITAVAAGGNHSLALRSDGTIFAWGDNTYGQLGNGDGGEYYNPTPGQVLTGTGSPYYTLSNVAAIVAGSASSYALLSNGIVVSWGHNEAGQLGHSGTADTWRALQVSSLANVTEIAAGNFHCLALSNGFVYGWGWNSSGQVGDGTTTTRTTPVPVSLSQGVVSLGAGYTHSFAIYSDGAVWAWGQNQKGQLGDGTTTQRITPIANGFYASRIDGGFYFTVAIGIGGSVWTWGQNPYGQLGIGTTTEQHSPVLVQCLPLAFEVTAGGSHCIAVREQMALVGWGLGAQGKIGDGTTTTRLAPVSLYGNFGL